MVPQAAIISYCVLFTPFALLGLLLLSRLRQYRKTHRTFTYSIVDLWGLTMGLTPGIAAIAFTHVDEELYFFAVAYVVGLITAQVLGALIGKLQYDIGTPDDSKGPARRLVYVLGGSILAPVFVVVCLVLLFGLVDLS